MGNFANTINNNGSTVSQKTDFISVSNHNQKEVTLRNLKQGQTFHGEVVEIDGKDIKLKLSDESIISAKLDKDIKVSLGQIIKLQVKSNSDSLLELKPILDSTQNKNIVKALKAADIPINDKTMALVNALMDEGLPIDKETIKQLYHQVLSNKDSNPTSIVQMNRLQIPITPENIKQFEAYKNYRHQIVKGVESVTNEIPKVLNQLITEGKGAQALDYYSKLIDVITEESTWNLKGTQGQNLKQIMNSQNLQGNQGQNKNQVLNSINPQGNQGQNANQVLNTINLQGNQEQNANQVINNQNVEGNQGQNKNQVLNTNNPQGNQGENANQIFNSQNPQENLGQNVKQIINSLNPQGQPIQDVSLLMKHLNLQGNQELEGNQILKNLNPEELQEEIIKAEINKSTNGQNDLVQEIKLGGNSSPLEKATLSNEINQILLPSERETLAKLLEPLKLPEKTMEQIKEGNISSREVLKLVQNVANTFSNLNSAQTIEDIFSSSEFTKLIKDQVMKQWTLEPVEVNQNKNVEELYSRMREQSMKMLEVLSSVGKEDTTMMKSVSNLQSNIDFMNQLNQLLSYVQLPIKMGKENAHGELYVYTNKKNLAKKDGKVSALLHLDMDNLGTLDVYVAMDNGKVSSKIYLEKEETINFIEKNVHILVERLQKRGYQMDVEVLKRGKSETIMEHIIEEEKPGQLLSKTAFDVRA